MGPQRPHDLLPLRTTEICLKFFERKVHDIVMVDFFRCQLVTHIQPDAVEKVDFLRRQMGRVRTEIEDMFLACCEIDAERQLRLGIRQVFPRQTSQARFFRDR